MPEQPLILSGDGELTTDQLAVIRQECSTWNTRASSFWDRRYEAEQARLCKWGGQSSDGRIWDDLNPTTRGLFNGAADLRVRWADTVTLDKQALLAGALSLAQIRIDGTGPTSQRTASALNVLLRWMIRDMGARWLGEWMALIHWYVSDTPGVAMMSVVWKRERHIEYRGMTLDELRGMWFAREIARAKDEYEAIDAQSSVEAGLAALQDANDPAHAQAIETAASLLAPANKLTMPEARAVIADLIKKPQETAEFIAEAAPEERAELTARRFGDDFVVKDNCKDFENDAPWFVPEWVSPEELRNRVATEGWNEEFVTEVLAQGENPVLANGTDGMDVTPAGESGANAKTGKRQVVWAYLIGVDKLGRSAKYVTVFAAGEHTAFGVRMLRGRRGRWPAVYFKREVTSRYLLDSRGVAELVAPAQGMAKSLLDAAANNGLVGGTPPVLAKGYSVRNQYVEPLRVIGMNVNEEFNFMQPPAFPAAALNVVKDLENQNNDYLGQSRADGPTAAAANRQRLEVSWFLAQACDVLRMMLELAQTEAPDDLLAQVTDDQGSPAGLRREDIAGRFRVAVTLNADDLDSERLVEKMKATGTVLMAMDRAGIIDSTPLIANALVKLFPDVGASALRTNQAAAESEAEAESMNLIKIRAGVMPTMNTDGAWDYAARLGFYEKLLQENPAVFSDLPQDRQDMLQRWTQALAQQQTQFGKNREIGRTGVEGVAEGG